MSVQVFYKNKAKSSGLGVIAIFGDEKFQPKNLSATFSKNEKVSQNLGIWVPVSICKKRLKIDFLSTL